MGFILSNLTSRTNFLDHVAIDHVAIDHVAIDHVQLKLVNDSMHFLLVLIKWAEEAPFSSSYSY